MKLIFLILFCSTQLLLANDDNIIKSIVANKHVTHAIEKRSFLQLDDCTIDSISLFFFNKINQKKIKAYSYSEKTDDFKIDNKWIRDFFDEKTDTIVTDTSIVYEKNKTFSINNPNNLFLKQTIFFNEKKNTLKSNVNYLAIPARHNNSFYDEDFEIPILYFSVNRNEKYYKPKGKKIGAFTTDIFRNDDSLNVIKNYFEINLIDLLFEKIKNNEFNAIDIDSNLTFFNNNFGYSVDTLYVTDPQSGLDKKIVIKNGFHKGNWMRVRFIEELFLSKKNILSTNVIAAIFYYTFDTRPEYIQYYPVFYIKFNELKDKNFNIAKYK